MRSWIRRKISSGPQFWICVGSAVVSTPLFLHSYNNFHSLHAEGKEGVELTAQQKIKKARKLIHFSKEILGFPGCSVAVMKDGKFIWEEGIGYADVENSIPMKPSHKLRIASISKTLTSAALGKLIEGGKLDIDAPVHKYLPDLPSFHTKSPQLDDQKEASHPDLQPPEGEKVTTRLLATHNSGIRHYSDRSEFLSSSHYLTVNDSLQIFINDPLEFKPGTGRKYSTYAWTLISAVVEGASGKKFLDYMTEEVFKPLGMKNTMGEFGTPIVQNRAKHYLRNKKGVLENAPYVDNSNKFAGGGFISTAHDIVLFGNAVMTQEILKRETVEDILWKPNSYNVDGSIVTSEGYGIGWKQVDKIRAVGTQGERLVSDKTVEHSGGAVGGTSYLMILPEKKLVVGIIVNLECGQGIRTLVENLAVVFSE